MPTENSKRKVRCLVNGGDVGLNLTNPRGKNQETGVPAASSRFDSSLKKVKVVFATPAAISNGLERGWRAGLALPKQTATVRVAPPGPSGKAGPLGSGKNRMPTLPSTSAP